jgi:hypothetical protein
MSDQAQLKQYLQDFDKFPPEKQVRHIALMVQWLIRIIKDEQATSHPPQLEG